MRYESALGGPHMALRAMPLSAGEDLWLGCDLLIELLPVVCGSRLRTAPDGNAADRRPQGTFVTDCGTNITVEKRRCDAFFH